MARKCQSAVALAPGHRRIGVGLYSGSMRFERIFEDLEGRLAHHEQQEMRAVSEDLTRAERAQLTFEDRLRGSQGARLTLHLDAGSRVIGVLEHVGAGWVALRESAGPVIVPLPRIALVDGLRGRARPAGDSLVGEMGLGAMLRRIARDRSTVRLETTAGALVGRISAAGADAVDLQTLPTGESGVVPGSGRITVTLDSLVTIRTG